LDNLDAQCVSALVSAGHKHFSTHFIGVNMRNHSIGFKVCELDRERFEGVTLGHVIFDPMLELLCGKTTTTHSLILIIGQRRRQQVAQL